MNHPFSGLKGGACHGRKVTPLLSQPHMMSASQVLKDVAGRMGSAPGLWRYWVPILADAAPSLISQAAITRCHMC